MATRMDVWIDLAWVGCLLLFKKKKKISGISLAVQWLELRTSTAAGAGSITGQGTKIPHGIWCGQKKIQLSKF